MAGLSASGLKTQIKSYTETDSNVLTDAVLENIILNAQYRIMRDVPIDADRKQAKNRFVAGQQTMNCPAGCLFTRGIQVYTSTDGTTISGANSWLEKKDQTYLNEYIAANTSTGTPKYYAQFGGATGTTDTTSGKYMFAPVPSTTYAFQVHFNAMPTSLVTNTSGTYISKNFPNGLLYACLIEAYGYLKGPIDMLTMYEQKYNNVIQKFAAEQIGRRRRDDYTDGTIRIPIESPNP